MRLTYFCFLTVMCWCFQSFGAVKSTSGNIRFDSNRDNQIEMNLNGSKLGIGIENPSANLHLVGNAIVSNDLYIGTSSGNSNLNIQGTVGYHYETVTSSTNLSGNSYAFANTANSNILLNLPYAANVQGREYTIKKISPNNSMWITGGGNYIDQNQSLTFAANSILPFIKVMSNGQQWYVMGQESRSSGTEVASGNLIGWYRFDETGSTTTAADSSGSGNTATVTNLGSWGAGKLGGAIHFGSSTYLSVGATSDYADLPGLTLSAWVYHNGNAADKAIINKFWDGANRQFMLNLNLVSGNLHLDFRIGTDAVSNVEISSGTLVSANTWHHVAGTWNRSQIAIYLDGVQTATLAGAGNKILNNNRVLKIGEAAFSVADRYGLGGGNNYIDDARIYNRALTAEEIKTLAQ